MVRMGEIRYGFPWLDANSSTVVLSANEGWSFGGRRANASFACQLAQGTRLRVGYDSFTLIFDPALKLQALEHCIDAIRRVDIIEMRPDIDNAVVEVLKFSEC